MKTAMQELIDELKRVQSMTNMNFVIKVATDLLEKEKEQLIEAVENGGNMIGGEEYYNETYKLNK